MIQLIGLLVIAVAGNRQPYWVCGLYLILLTVVAFGAARCMDNLEHATQPSHLRSILPERDTWLLALLYLGTFGSWIGFSFAFGQVLQVSFIDSGQSHAHASLHAAELAFIGPALGSLSRIYGGRLADRLGGSRVTLAVFSAMVLATGVLVTVSAADDRRAGPTTVATIVATIVAFIALFILAGLGSGSVYKMIPTVFEARSYLLNVGETERRHWSNAMSGAVIGFVAAFGALGGVAVNLTLRQSFLVTGTDTSAFRAFLLFYVGAVTVTWIKYVRQPAITRCEQQETAPQKKAALQEAASR
jgi:NNP family nitrate/nitrite transporter-like MFS transporter